ncbi:inward rectifier K channel (IRK-C) family protein, partial [Achlya hypogyna]
GAYKKQRLFFLPTWFQYGASSFCVAPRDVGTSRGPTEILSTQSPGGGCFAAGYSRPRDRIWQKHARRRFPKVVARARRYGARGSALLIPPPEYREMTDTKLEPTRLIDRNGPYRQSRGTWNIRRIRTPEAWKLYFQAPFHTLVNQSFSKVLFWFAFVYLGIICFFALMYMTVPKECNLVINNFAEAWIFSVSVIATIGFGTGGNDIFFNSCGSAITAITAESMAGVLVNAVVFGVVYQRFARGQARASTVAVSNYACLQKIRGQIYFMFQTCEMRKHQLNEAHVRCYAVLHKSRHPNHMQQIHHVQSFPMRLQHPDDDLNAWLILALPSIVVHRLDSWSPLLPPDMQAFPTEHNPSTHYRFPEPVQRAADLDAGNREDRHRGGKGPLFNVSAEPEKQTLTNAEINCILAYWKEVHLEIVVLIEGIDASSSATIQMRQSYKPTEIMFNHEFVNAVDFDPHSGAAVIDFNRFHRTAPMDLAVVEVAEKED